MTLIIQSDGTAAGTRVIDAESGQIVENVTAISWVWTETRGHCAASITIAGVPVQLTLPDAELTTDAP